MHDNQSGNEENRLKAVKALLSPDVTRDEVLEKFVQLAAQALGISGSFISIIDDKINTLKFPATLILRRRHVMFPYVDMLLMATANWSFRIHCKTIGSLSIR